MLVNIERLFNSQYREIKKPPDTIMIPRGLLREFFYLSIKISKEELHTFVL